MLKALAPLLESFTPEQIRLLTRFIWLVLAGGVVEGVLLGAVCWLVARLFGNVSVRAPFQDMLSPYLLVACVVLALGYNSWGGLLPLLLFFLVVPTAFRATPLDTFILGLSATAVHILYVFILDAYFWYEIFPFARL